MMIPEFQKLLIKEPYAELKGYTTYGDWVEIYHKTTPVNDIEDIRAVLEEQCENSLIAIRDKTGEVPVAIHFLLQPHPDLKGVSMFGWQIWTKKP